jgi:hypothetical protein
MSSLRWPNRFERRHAQDLTGQYRRIDESFERIGAEFTRDSVWPATCRLKAVPSVGNLDPANEIIWYGANVNPTA